MPINSANAQCPMFSQDFYGWSSIIQDLTTKLQCLPYNPLTWFSRGIGLYKIGYPELCVGDMHRARLFVEAALARTTEFRNEALLVYGLELWLEEPTWAIRGLDGFEQHVKSSLRKLEKNIWISVTQVLWDLQALWDETHLHDLCSKSGLPWLDHFRQGMLEKETMIRRHQIGNNADQVQAALRNGFCLARPYPWMRKAMLQRRDKDIEKCSTLLVEASEGRCKLAKSIIQGAKPDVYGVIATRSLAKGQTVMALGAAVIATSEEKNRCSYCMKSLGSGAFPLLCCTDKVCSHYCADQALSTSHKVLCGKTMNFRIHLTGDFRMTTMVRLRTLAAIVQADNGKTHPLFHPAVSCLTPNDALPPSPWTYHEDIIYPFEMLQQLGINIFTDMRYDTWVLRTLFSRIKNNSSGEGGESVFLDPLYSMLNHSCHRNMRAEQISPRSFQFQATRDIQQGEELFISYIGDVTSVPYKYRQQELKEWFDGLGGCACARCKIDSKGSIEEKRTYYRQHQQAYA